MIETLSSQQLAKEAESSYLAGDFMLAAQQYEAAHQSYLSKNDILMSAEMANNCSVAYLQAGDNEAALGALDGIEVVFQQAGDRKRQAMTLGNRAAALEALDRLIEAEKTYWMAAEIFKELGETELRLPIMQSISTIQLRTGRHLQAVASMYAGVEKIKNPSLKHRFLKRLLAIPIQLINQRSNDLPDGTHDNP
jgi:tetratricopeptide (TPR) repeat protein